MKAKNVTFNLLMQNNFVDQGLLQLIKHMNCIKSMSTAAASIREALRF